MNQLGDYNKEENLYCTIFHCLDNSGDHFYQIRLWDENDKLLSQEFARKQIDRFYPGVRIDWEESFVE
jgi:hypothetical protein